MKKIRAIYIGDLRYNECQIFELNQEDKHFEMINDKSYKYHESCVFEDSNFLIFEVENDEVKQIIK